jgi:pteridine reductase
LVTGAGRPRLGQHIAEALAGRGYRLAVHYRHARDEAESFADRLRLHGRDAMTFGADLADEPQVERLMDAVLDRFGRIDVLVNTAAIWEPNSLESTSAADVRSHFDTNVLGPFLASKRAGLAMAGQAEGGCILHFGDWATVRPYEGYSAYFLSKGTIPTMTRMLAVELGRRNPRIRVNAILPGPAMLPESMPSDEREAIRSATLLQREGSPESIVRAALYLIDNEFVTGTCLTVDGGRTVYAGGL